MPVSMHGDRDALAREAAGSVPHGRRVHVLGRRGVVELEDARDLDALDPGELLELRHLPGRNDRRDAVEGVLEAQQHGAAEGGDLCGDGAPPILQLGADRVLLALAERRSGLLRGSRALGDGSAVELQDDAHRTLRLQRRGLEVRVVACAEQSSEPLGRRVGERADPACVRRRACSGACRQDDGEQGHGEERGSPFQTTSHVPLSSRFGRRACRGGKTLRIYPRRRGPRNATIQ